MLQRFKECYLHVEDVVRREVVEVVRVDVVDGVVALVAMESVLSGLLKMLLRKLLIGLSVCCRSHSAVARGARVGCTAMSTAFVRGGSERIER